MGSVPGRGAEQKRKLRAEGPAAYQLDGGVVAHRGDDGSLV
jgi:hypothetical protein